MLDQPLVSKGTPARSAKETAARPAWGRGLCARYRVDNDDIALLQITRDLRQISADQTHGHGHRRWLAIPNHQHKGTSRPLLATLAALIIGSALSTLTISSATLPTSSTLAAISALPTVSALAAKTTLTAVSTLAAKASLTAVSALATEAALTTKATLSTKAGCTNRSVGNGQNVLACRLNDAGVSRHIQTHRRRCRIEVDVDKVIHYTLTDRSGRVDAIHLPCQCNPRH